MPSAPPSRQRQPRRDRPCGTRTSGAMPASSAATEIGAGGLDRSGAVLEIDEQPIEAGRLHDACDFRPRTPRTPIPGEISPAGQALLHYV